MDIRVSSEETGLYYLNARYYDPEIGRFLSAGDTSHLDTEVLGGRNLYAYCLDDSVMYINLTGNFPVLAFVLGIIALVGMGLTIGGLVIVAGIGGANLTGIVGGVTAVAGIGNSLFASAEYQEALMGNSCMDARCRNE